MKIKLMKFAVVLGVTTAAMTLVADGLNVIRPNYDDSQNTLLYEQQGTGSGQKSGSISIPSVGDFYQYTWTVTLTDVKDPTALPQLTAYLVNTAVTRDGPTGYYVYTSVYMDDRNPNARNEIGVAGTSPKYEVTLNTTVYSDPEITYNDANLATVLIATDQAGNVLGMQELATHYSDTSAHRTFSANAQYNIPNVPEPTSGMLLLLGLAGLALKRKGAA